MRERGCCLNQRSCEIDIASERVSKNALDGGVKIYIEAEVYHQKRYDVLVSKWGNSLALRLPQAVVEALELHAGDSVEIQVLGARTLSVEKAPAARKLVARLRSYRGRLPDGFRFDRLEANERD